MELLKLIRVRKDKNQQEGSINWAAKYKGSMQKQPLNEVDNQLNDLRGSVREPGVIRSNNKDFSIEALRLIIEAPDWGPGMQNNKAVNSIIAWTIDFEL